MKATTIHINALGEVTNPISAQGFRLEDAHGDWIEARVIDGELRVLTGGRYSATNVTRACAGLPLTAAAKAAPDSHPTRLPVMKADFQTFLVAIRSARWLHDAGYQNVAVVTLARGYRVSVQ